MPDPQRSFIHPNMPVSNDNPNQGASQPRASQEIHLDPITLDDGSDESYIFATVRYDPILMTSPENQAASFNRRCPFYLLEHQWTRLQVANWCTSFYRTGSQQNSTGGPANFLYGLLSAVRRWQQIHPGEHPESLRIKIRSYISGRVTTEIWPLPRIPLSALFVKSFGKPEDLPKSEWVVVMDAEPTEATESTMYKTSDRFPYGRARAMAGISTNFTTKEVLLYNTADEILDGSASTPYFYREGRWVTPASASGGLQGTTRRWALENGLGVEGVVMKDSIRFGEKIWFSNAVKGFFHGTFQPRDPDIRELDMNECRRIQREMQY
jgi:4-amino-4-deoxychorismate lyase